MCCPPWSGHTYSWELRERTPVPDWATVGRCAPDHSDQRVLQNQCVCVFKLHTCAHTLSNKSLTSSIFSFFGNCASRLCWKISYSGQKHVGYAESLQIHLLLCVKHHTRPQQNSPKMFSFFHAHTIALKGRVNLDCSIIWLKYIYF